MRFNYKIVRKPSGSYIAKWQHDSFFGILFGWNTLESIGYDECEPHLYISADDAEKAVKLYLEKMVRNCKSDVVATRGQITINID